MPETTTVTEAVLNQVAKSIHHTAVEKGFWEPPDPFAAELNMKLLLIVSEVCEAQAVIRERYLDTPIEPFSQMTPQQGRDFFEELADIIIRTLDLAQYFNWNFADTILAKMAKNTTRPSKHGKQF